jgi:glyoxylase-like metal-dependent hydrolase (beta-lactamase superfamily II)
MSSLSIWYCGVKWLGSGFEGILIMRGVKGKMRLIENLYYYPWQGMGNNCNTYLFAGDVLTIIDPGMVVDELNEPCLELLLASMKEDGFAPGDIELIILTHSHLDHSGAVAELVKMSGAKLTIHQVENEWWEKMGGQMCQFLGINFVRFDPDFFIEEGGLNLGRGEKTELTVLHTPGHSPGSISLYWPRGKALISGDVIFELSVGRVDFPGGDAQLLKQSIEKLSGLEVEHLLPGHMGIVSGRANVEKNFSYVTKAFFPWL